MGACGILGRAHAQLLVEHGARLIIADRPGSSILEDAKKIGIPGFEINAAEEKSIIAGVASIAHQCLILI